MEMYLQFGWNMKGLCVDLIRLWQGGTVILSPRDLEPNQIITAGRDIRAVGGEVLLDPQLYDPRASHPRLSLHEWRPKNYATSMFMGGPALNTMLSGLDEVNSAIQARKYIVPGLLSDRVDSDWFAIHEAVITASATIVTDKQRLATICLSGETLRSDEQVQLILENVESWNVDGFYIVPEHPQFGYFTDDALWLKNLLSFCAGLKRLNKEVVVSHCSHQMLCLAVANVDAIASGHFQNVRMFVRNRYEQSEEEGRGERPPIYYYCPQSLSEYRITFLDIAFSEGILDQLVPSGGIISPYDDNLFAGGLPSRTGFSEPPSFRHYLHCLHEQTAGAKRSSYRETLNAQNTMLTDAMTLLGNLRRVGVRDSERDFAPIVDVNRSALASLDVLRGPILGREWS